MTNEQKLPISIVLLTRNEEHNIHDCLQSCAFASEVIIVDDGSSDRTVALAQEMGAKVFHREMAGDWGKQQTFGIEKATQPWIYLLDADERITPALESSIRKFLATGKQFCCWVQRENHFQNEKATHGVMRPDWVARLMPREGASVEGRVHPKIISPFKKKKIRGRMIHYPYRSWDHYFSKLDKYSRLSAQKYLDEGRDVSFFRDILLRPMWAFFKVYFINLGLLDGRMGFIFSASHYFYTLSKYVRFYQLKKHQGVL